MTESLLEHSHETSNEAKGNYATVNGLKMYYEIHGTGRPLVLLHGGFMVIEALGALLPRSAARRAGFRDEPQNEIFRDERQDGRQRERSV